MVMQYCFATLLCVCNLTTHKSDYALPRINLVRINLHKIQRKRSVKIHDFYKLKQTVAKSKGDIRNK